MKINVIMNILLEKLSVRFILYYKMLARTICR